MFSNSVADAIEFCAKSNIHGIEDSEATVNFIRTINRLFDIFNMRNLLGFGHKKASFKSKLFRNYQSLIDKGELD